MAETLATTLCDGGARPVEEQTRATSGNDVEPLGMSGGWKQERLEADSLLRSLHGAHCEDEKHRKWLLRRWPEWPREGRTNSVSDQDRFIPDFFLRDGEDDVSGSLQSIKSLVRGGFGLLQGEDDEGGQLDVSGMVTRLSDEGVAEAIPLLLPRLKRKALQSVLSILSNRRREARNRPWLIEKLDEEWMTVASQNSASLEALQKIVAVVRDPNSFREEALPGQLLLEASCPWSAARSALTETQLEQIPLTGLQVMLEVLLEKPPEVMVGKLPVGGNKERLITALLEKGRDLLSYEQEGEVLPEALRKSLVVMSLSAKYSFGDDSNLIDFLGPQSLETELLQDNLLSALSCLKNLDYGNLQVLHRVLIGAPRLYKKRHPGNLRHAIRRVLLDCLLRSEVRSVPEEVKTAAVTIGTLARKQSGGHKQAGSDAKLKVTVASDGRIEREVESALRISSHLLQIIYNWNEVLLERASKEQDSQRLLSRSDVVNCSLVNGIGTLNATETTHKLSSGTEIRSSGDAIQIGEEIVAADMAGRDNEDKITRLESDSFHETAQLPQKGGTDTTRTNRPDPHGDVEIHGELGEAIENPHLTRIADEAAEVGYALVGCAMERTARSSGVSLKRPVRKYLRCGTIKKVRAGTGDGTDLEQHQLAMILKIAKKIPAISPRVMGNVKRRLGMG